MEKKPLGWKYYKYLIIVLIIIISFLEIRLYSFYKSVQGFKELSQLSQSEYLNSSWLKADLFYLYYAAKIPFYGNHFRFKYKYSTAELFYCYYKEIKEVEGLKHEFKIRYMIKSDSLVSKHLLDSNYAIKKLDSILYFKCSKWNGISKVIPVIDANTTFCNKRAANEFENF
jgi:hypothetical protein